MKTPRTEAEQYKLNNQRSADSKRLHHLIDDNSRLTLTEKRFLKDIERDFSLEIVDHYVLSEGEKEILSAFEDRIAIVTRDEHEEELERVYHTCKMMEREWYGYCAPTLEALIPELLELIAKLSRDPGRNNLRLLASVAVYATVLHNRESK